MTRPNLRLFTYGTLRDPHVQVSLFGRQVPGAADVLLGYRLGTVTIRDDAVITTSGSAVHLCVDHTGEADDRVEGMVLSLTEAELAAADAYETADYRRVTVTLASGMQAYLYARA
ncbi:MAG TPA: gamma-glutamylcyclotransferase family protein [Allosphingosinicella sp.]|nr:gamma-glutamylcyclotransferase family protein [Allosphingosinicella sp.]